MTQLSDHFTLEELIASPTASRLGLGNEPTPVILGRLSAVAQQMEKVRDLLGGKPIRVSSGYRSPAVNRAVNGARTSAHCLGYAVDFTCAEVGDPFAVCSAIARADLPFDQLIHEFGSWTHISFDPQLRRQTLTIRRANHYEPGILRV
jgi:zinc D-Ala-D-Ala carboxypeptidase